MPRLGLDWRDGCSISSSDTTKKRQAKGFDRDNKIEAAKEELRKITGDRKAKLISVEPIKEPEPVVVSEDDYLKGLTYTFDDKTIPIKGSSHLVASISPGFDRFGVHIIITFKSGRTAISHKWS